MHTHLCTEADRDRWNDFAAWAPGGDLLQSYEWGELKARSGWTPLRLALLDGSRIVGAASLLKRSLPLPGKSILYAPRGPLLREWSLPLLRALLEGVRDLARREGAILLKVDPALQDPEVARLLGEAGFVSPPSSSGFGGVQPRCVMVLDLRRSQEEIFAGFKPKWRYNIRLAERKGVVVRADTTREDLKLFYDLLQVTARRDGFLVRSFEYFADMWDLLVPRRMARLFLAEVAGDPVAGALCFLFGDTCWYTYGASADVHREKMPNHLMQWTMIRWAHDHGYHVYDFRGVSPQSQPEEGDKLAGLNRFKAGFGAQFVEYVGEFDLPLSRPLYQLWVRGLPVARRILKRRGRSGEAPPSDSMG